MMLSCFEHRWGSLPVEKLLTTSPTKFLTISLLALICCVGSAKSEVRTEVGAAPSRALVVQNYYYALPGKATDVYLWRLHASDVRAKLGLARGRVLRRVPDPKTNKLLPALPDVIWECDYSNAEAREADVARLDKSEEFDEVQKHMDTLVRDFRRVMFQVSD
jgi:hypothetical protein